MDTLPSTQCEAVLSGAVAVACLLLVGLNIRMILLRRGNKLWRVFRFAQCVSLLYAAFIMGMAAARQMQLIPAVVRATLLIVVAAAIMDRLACVQGGCIDGEGS